MRNGLSQAALVAAFAAVFGVSTAAAQTSPEQVPALRPDGTVIQPGRSGVGDSGSPSVNAPEQVPVKRPDGTVVEPPAASDRARPPSAAGRDSVIRSDDRERMRQEGQQAADERIERSRREREAATTSPARQIPPTVYPR